MRSPAHSSWRPLATAHALIVACNVRCASLPRSAAAAPATSFKLSSGEVVPVAPEAAQLFEPLKVRSAAQRAGHACPCQREGRQDGRQVPLPLSTRAGHAYPSLRTRCAHAERALWGGTNPPPQVGDMSLTNRVVYAPLTRCRALGNVINATAGEYYAQRAVPGGLLISEATNISEEARGSVGVGRAGGGGHGHYVCAADP